MVGNVVSFPFSSGPQFNQGSRDPLRLGVAFPTTPRLQLALELNCPGSVQFVGLILPSNSNAVILASLRNFFRYLAIGMYHFRYLCNGLCDRHRAEITVIQFRGHSLPSVYESIMGFFFTSSHFISQFPPTRFPLITTIGMFHFLPVHHLEWHFWPGQKVKS